MTRRNKLLHQRPEFARRGVAGDDLVIVDARLALFCPTAALHEDGLPSPPHRGRQCLGCSLLLPEPPYCARNKLLD